MQHRSFVNLIGIERHLTLPLTHTTGHTISQYNKGAGYVFEEVFVTSNRIIVSGPFFLELEARWSPLESWFFEGALGYLDATITESDPTVVNSGGPSAGDRLPQVPRWTGAVSAIKEVGLGDRGTLTVRVDYAYRSKVFFAPDNDPFTVQGSFGLLNASVAWNSADDRYGLTLYANNITDEHYILYTELSGSAGTQNDVLARDFAWYLTGEYRF